MTWGDGTTGITGNVSASNSAVGNSTDAGNSLFVANNTSNDAFYVSFKSDGSGRVLAGSQSQGFASTSGSLNSGGGAIALQANSVSIQTSACTSTANQITITANALDLGTSGSVNATTTGNITIRTLGGNVDLGTQSAGNLGLTQAAFNNITAQLLTIGSNTTGNISLSANLSWTSNIVLDSNVGTYGSLSNSNQTLTQGIYQLTVSSGSISILNPQPTIYYTILISSNAPVTYGSDILLTASLTHSGSAFNSGTVSFYNNGVLIGTSNISADTANYTWSGVDAGTYSNITATGNVTGGTDNGSNTANVVVSPANLTITANNASAIYGTAATFNNATDFTTGTLYNGDTIGSVNLTSSGATNTANIGSYAITGSGAVLSAGNISNYNITYADGSLTVSPTNLTLTAGNQTKRYGDTLVLGTSCFTISGTLYNGDTIPSATLTASEAGNATARSGITRLFQAVLWREIPVLEISVITMSRIPTVCFPCVRHFQIL